MNTTKEESETGSMPAMLGDARIAQELALLAPMRRVPLFDEDKYNALIVSAPEMAKEIDAAIPLSGQYATVYPVGVVHLRRFSKQLMGAIAVMTRALALTPQEVKDSELAASIVREAAQLEAQGIEASPELLGQLDQSQALLRALEKKQTEAAVSILGPYVSTTLLDLVEDCVMIPVEGKSMRLSQALKIEAVANTLPHWIMPKIVEAWVAMSFGSEEKWRPWVAAAEQALSRMAGKQVSLSGALSVASSALASLTGTFSTTAATDGPTTDGATQS